MENEHSNRRLTWLGVSLVAGGIFYRPLVFWAKNAWDLAHPENVFLTASVGLAIALLLFFVLVAFGVREIPAGFIVSGVFLVLFNYHVTPLVPGVVWLVVIVAIGTFLHSSVSDQTNIYLVTVLLVFMMLAPAIQVAVQHVSHRIPYPLAEVQSPVAARATGSVEDVLVVIVDGYPMLSVADHWFGHNTELLRRGLTEAGFQVPKVSWSHNTFTGLAVPSILQLDQVADDSPKGSWGNRQTNYEIIGGESFVVETLRRAGFQYIHIEGGWNGAACTTVDVCLKSSWLGEANWNLLATSIFADAMVERYGSMPAANTIHVVDHLTNLDAFDDNEPHLVFAHMFLPHAPYVVDSGCNVVPTEDRVRSDNEYHRIRKQLECVDSLLLDVVESLDRDTAVLIAADHGTGEGGQVGSPFENWSDADIAERLGALLAYRIPERCSEPEEPTNVYAMRAIMECTVVADLPTEPVRFLIGADQPEWVTSEQVSAIATRLAEGSLSGPD